MNRCAAIEKILDKHDLFGLYKRGAPQREYRSEALLIEERLSLTYPECTKLELGHVLDIVSSVFRLQFDELCDGISSEEWLALAHDIMIWKSFGED